MCVCEWGGGRVWPPGTDFDAYLYGHVCHGHVCFILVATFCPSSVQIGRKLSTCSDHMKKESRMPQVSRQQVCDTYIWELTVSPLYLPCKRLCAYDITFDK